MRVEVADSERKLANLEESWNELAARCSPLSLYSTYDYNAIAWRHLGRPGDRLFVLALHAGASLAAIAPFCITARRVRGIPVRSIEFIAAREGDKPSLIAPSGETAAWDAIFAFLSTEFTSWDILDLKEQPQDAPLLTRSTFLRDRRLVCTISHDSTSYHVDLTGSWDAYYAARSASVKKRLRKRGELLRELPGGLRVETIVEPARVVEGLARLAALEKLSWKGAARVGLHADGALRRFYEEFTLFAAERNRAAIVFLRAGTSDLACYLNYMFRDVVYARHTAYDPEYGKLAPGIYLKAEIIKGLFGTAFRELDEMGMHPREGAPLGKVEWASETRETRRLLVEKKNLRLMPLLLARRIKAAFKSPGPRLANQEVSTEPCE